MSAAPSPSERLYAGQVLAGYRLEKTVGRGGFGEVLQATRVSDGRTVALKVLRAKHRGDLRREKQLLREGKLLKSLQHPRVLGCLDVGRSGAWTFLVLPWIQGRPLSSVLERGPLKPKIALDCGFQILEALEYIHKKGVTHQDVKPDNVLIDEQRLCTLHDFGLALTRADSLKERASGGVLRIAGSASYRAPEQSDPRAPVGSRADIYAFGVTLHRLMTRELPEDRVPSARLPESLRALLAQCLEVEPEKRPSASTLRRALHELE